MTILYSYNGMELKTYQEYLILSVFQWYVHIGFPLPIIMFIILRELIMFLFYALLIIINTLLLSETLYLLQLYPPPPYKHSICL